MTMQTFVDGQLRALGGCAAYLIVASLFTAGARWLLPLPFWVFMLLGGAAHIAGRAAFKLARYGRDKSGF
jgi:hypothetical protein